MAVFLLKSMDINVNPDTYIPDHPFTDIKDFWAEPWIDELEDHGVTGGYPDGTYRPLNLVTRAEMAIFLINAFNLQ